MVRAKKKHVSASSFPEGPDSSKSNKDATQEPAGAFAVKELPLGRRHKGTEPALPSTEAVDISSNWLQLQKKLGRGDPTLKRKRKQEASLQDHDALEEDKNRTKSLVPLSTDCSVTQVLALDCEMVGVGYDGKKSSLARVSLVNSSGNVIYDKCVRPMGFVTDCRTKITGFRISDLRQGEPFTVVQKEVSELLTGRILVGHALHNDLKALLLTHPRKDIRDTATYEHFRSKAGRPQSLKYLADKYLGCKIQEGVHSSVEDARVAMFLYNTIKDQWEKHYGRRHE